jgi:hypothetical protein
VLDEEFGKVIFGFPKPFVIPGRALDDIERENQFCSWYGQFCSWSE